MQGSFFNFLFGFIFIISMGLGVAIAVDYYNVSADGLQQAAASLFLLQ